MDVKQKLVETAKKILKGAKITVQQNGDDLHIVISMFGFKIVDKSFDFFKDGIGELEI